MTKHNGPAASAERATWWQLVHYVDGVPLIGGRALPMSELLRDSYLQEAGDLTGDLAEVVRELDPADAGFVVGQVVAALSDALPTELAVQLHRLQDAMHYASTGSEDPGTGPPSELWTFDGATGGPVDGYPTPEPAGQETDTEAPIRGDLVATDTPPDTDDRAEPAEDESAGENGRASVTDFLASTANAMDRAAGLPAQPKRSRRTRKANGA
jgi:hypothetical protein